MQAYYFQIFSPGKDWEDITATPRVYETRAMAVKWAKYLSATNNGLTVRMSDNAKLLQGSYFKEAPILWKCTDPDHAQYGRHIEGDHFQFYEGEQQPVDIHINHYGIKEIEEILHTYSYTLGPSKDGKINIRQIYGRAALWIIAECIYESTAAPLRAASTDSNM